MLMSLFTKKSTKKKSIIFFSSENKEASDYHNVEELLKTKKDFNEEFLSEFYVHEKKHHNLKKVNIHFTDKTCYLHLIKDDKHLLESFSETATINNIPLFSVLKDRLPDQEESQNYISFTDNNFTIHEKKTFIYTKNRGVFYKTLEIPQSLIAVFENNIAAFDSSESVIRFYYKNNLIKEVNHDCKEMKWSPNGLFLVVQSPNDILVFDNNGDLIWKRYLQGKFEFRNYNLAKINIKNEDIESLEDKDINIKKVRGSLDVQVMINGWVEFLEKQNKIYVESIKN